MSIPEITLILSICGILASVTYWRRLLNRGGSITALIIGVIIGIEGGILWIVLLLIFLGSSFLATRYKFNYKKEKGFQEGDRGERGTVNVLANGLVPLFLSLIHLDTLNNILFFEIIPHKLGTILFITAVAGAAADTLASEMGILSDKTYLITSFKRVKSGINGGISLLGELWALIGAGYTFFISFLVFNYIEGLFISPWVLLIGVFISFFSCQIDSFFGATLERKGYIGKSTVNLMAISISVTIMGGILCLIGF